MTVALDRLHVPAGTPLFFEGDAGDFAYLVVTGEIEIVVRREARDVVLARRGPGEVIGEMALLDGGSRSASARVSVDCELVAISAEQIATRIAESDPVLRLCLGAVLDRFRETQSRLDATRIAAPPQVRTARGFDDSFRAAVRTLTMERQIEGALERDEFELFLQPIVELPGRGIAGFEALVRWNHPTRGLLTPVHFIPAAETSGQVVHLTEWMMVEVAAAVPRLLAAAGPAWAGTEPFFVSINVSVHDLLRPAFADTVQETLAAMDVAPHHVKLEITEGMLMRDPAGASRVLETCRGRGMGIAIDDFGTGYSNLSYLSTLPITTLKLDRAFVSSMTTDPTSRKIVSTVQHLARELGLSVVAEGIEREEEADLLGALCCEYGQGYLFGRPAPLAAALDLLRSHHPAPPDPTLPPNGRTARPSLEKA